MSNFAPSELRWLSDQLQLVLGWELASFACIGVASLLALVPPLALGWLIDTVLPQRKLAALVAVALLLFLSYLARTVLTSLSGCLTLTAAQKMGFHLRMFLVRHLDALSADYYEDTPVGRIIYPLQDPIEEIAYFGSDLVPSILRALLTTLFALTAMVLLNPLLTLTIFPLIPAFILTREYFRHKLVIVFDQVQQRQKTWADFLHEHFSAVLPIQLLGRETRQERRAFCLLGEIAHSQQRLFRTGAYFSVYTSLFIVMAMAVAVGFGGWSVFVGRLSVGKLVVFYTLVTYLFEPLSAVTEIYTRIQRVFANVRQVQTVLSYRPALDNRAGSVQLPESQWHLEIRGLTFQYAKQRGRLRVPSLRIQAGEQVALVGENGAGKSTLAKLIVRIYDVGSGSICIAGEDVRNVTLKSLRRTVCYLARDPVLFQGTLSSNLRFVTPSASDAELENALQRAGLSVLLASLKDGLRQSVGPQGCQLSGGQRQRLAIARAMLQGPKILILDEATSCLDPVSEQLVLRNLRNYLPESTLIVVSHRLSTVLAFPRILVLAEGQIVEDSCPEHLARHSDFFANWFPSPHSGV
ncbi:MAG: ABC transporter ATP-binding protein [Acidobacteria bacterium]|nr:ABC transporter ATP-binding protein [Acidobacteriota bacterium]